MTRINRISKIFQRIAPVFLTLIVGACSQTGNQQALLEDRCFIVPGENFVGMSKKDTELELGFDSTAAELVVQFGAPIFANAIAANGTSSLKSPTDRPVDVIITASSQDELNYHQSGTHYEDMWRALGSYSTDRMGRVVTENTDSGLFKVNRRTAPSNWIYTDIDPRIARSGLPSNSHVIAHCSTRSDSAPSCTRSAFLEGLRIEYHFDEELIGAYEEFDEVLFSTINGWEVDTDRCS